MRTKIQKDKKDKQIKRQISVKKTPEVRRAMRVGRREDGAGPGAIEVGQSQEGTFERIYIL